MHPIFSQTTIILQFLFSNIFPNESYYIGDFKHGEKHGKGEFHWNDGRVYKGEWENGDMNGHGIMTYPDGTKETGKWKDDEFIG